MIIFQLTTETVDTAVSSLAQVLELTQGNEVEQNSAVLQTIAGYLTDVANFVNNTNVTINATVSCTGCCKLWGGRGGGGIFKRLKVMLIDSVDC
jgi:hypothetical protein